MSNNNKTKRVCLNLIQQEVYARNPSVLDGLKTDNASKAYYELRQIETDDGICERLVKTDYNITAEYVNSFESSANFKNDVQSALNAPKKLNIGDITAVQELLEMDTTAVKDTLAKIEALKAQAIAQNQQQQREVKEDVK